MKIKRTLTLGDFTTEIEIELTYSELWDAYCEKEHDFDIEDVNIFLDNLIALDREDHDILVYFSHNPEALSEIAYDKRKYQDNGCDFENATYSAIEDAVDEYETHLTKVFGI